MPASFKITYANGSVEERSLPDGSHEIGRDSGAVVLRDPGVSARHARIDITNGEAWLSDLGSSNGTFDETGARLSGARGMRPHEAFRLGGSSIALLPVPGATRAMPQFAPAAPMPQAGHLQQLPNAGAPGSRDPRVFVPSDWSHRRYVDVCPLVFGVVTGVVSGSETRSESYVSGYVSSSGGGQISTHVIPKCEFVLHSDDGKQASYTLTNINVILRNGQRISMLWGAVEGTNRYTYLRLVHHDGETVHRLDPAKKAALALGQAKAITSQGGCLVALLGTLLLVVVIVNGAYDFYKALWVPAVVGLLMWARADGRSMKAMDRLDRYVDGLGAELLAFVVAEKRKRGL